VEKTQPVISNVPPQTQMALVRLISQETLEGCLAAFLLACKVEELSPSTISSYSQFLGDFVKNAAALGITQPKQLTFSHISKLLQKKQETCSPVSIYAHYRHIKRFCNWLVEEKVLAESPMRHIKPPRVPHTLIKPFTLEQVKRILALCDESTFLGLRNKAIILVFVETAIRLSEMARMQIQEIDFETGLIKIMGKGSRERVVAIQDKTKAILRRYLLSRNDRHGCVWVNEERQPLTLSGIGQMIRSLGKQAGLRNVRCSPHTFRHTSATMMLDSGAREFEVQAILGHSTLTMTRRYMSSLNSEKAAEAHKRFSPVEHFQL